MPSTFANTIVSLPQILSYNRYVTIMSYTDDCHGGYANYYSNPDVIHLGKPTGTDTENCARRITETMVRP